MFVGSSLFEAAKWHVRGLFATEANRRIGFALRTLWQPAEIEARRGLARQLACELDPELALDHQVGYRRLSQRALPDLSNLCAIGRELVNRARAGNGEANGGKVFSRFHLGERDERTAILRVALDPRMLALASSYLGVLPVIIEADFYYSFFAGGAFTKSQLWHCDDDAGEVLKIFIHCEDVTVDDGPFELVPPGRSAMVRNAVGYRFAGRRYRVSDELMARHVSPSEHVVIDGPRGTTFAVDTVQCFHRGSRITIPDRHRVVAMICYCPPSGATLPRRLAAAPAPLVEFAPMFESPLARAALGVPLASKWL